MIADWDAYLETLRELHRIRANAADRSEETEETLRERGAQIDTLAQKTTLQEDRVCELADELRQPVRFTSLAATPPAEAMPWDTAVADLTGHLNAADSAAFDAERYALLPPLLPTWSSSGRNALIYFGYALPNVCVNWVLGLFYVTNDTSRDITAALWGCCFWPVAAVVAGIATIRAVGVPRLKPKPKDSWEQPKDHRVLLSIPLGLVIAFGTAIGSVIVLWLAGAFFSS